MGGDARVHLDRDLRPGLEGEPVREGAPDATITTSVCAAYPGLAHDANSPALRLACAVAGSNRSYSVAYGTEAGLFQQAGIPAVICGPGSINQAHKADEFIAL